LAGVALADHLLDDAAEPAAALRRAMPSFRFKQLLRAGYDLPPQTERAADLLFALPAFRHLAQTIFFHHCGLFSAEAWREILNLGHRRAGPARPPILGPKFVSPVVAQEL
jgi:hypothetical protein